MLYPDFIARSILPSITSVGRSGVCRLVFISRYMWSEGPWQQLCRCPQATGGIYIHFSVPPLSYPCPASPAAIEQNGWHRKIVGSGA